VPLQVSVHFLVKVQPNVVTKSDYFVKITTPILVALESRNFKVQVVPLDLAERQEALEPQVPALMPLVEILVALRAVLVQLEACYQRDQAALAAVLAAVLVAAQQEKLMTVASLAAPQLAKATAAVQECLPQLARRLLRQAQLDKLQQAKVPPPVRKLVIVVKQWESLVQQQAPAVVIAAQEVLAPDPRQDPREQVDPQVHTVHLIHKVLHHAMLKLSALCLVCNHHSAVTRLLCSVKIIIKMMGASTFCGSLKFLVTLVQLVSALVLHLMMVLLSRLTSCSRLCRFKESQHQTSQKHKPSLFVWILQIHSRSHMIPLLLSVFSMEKQVKDVFVVA